jgi:hypothetical protein
MIKGVREERRGEGRSGEETRREETRLPVPRRQRVESIVIPNGSDGSRTHTYVLRTHTYVYLLKYNGIPFKLLYRNMLQ